MNAFLIVEKSRMKKIKFKDAKACPDLNIRPG